MARQSACHRSSGPWLVGVPLWRVESDGAFVCSLSVAVGDACCQFGVGYFHSHCRAFGHGEVEGGKIFDVEFQTRRYARQPVFIDAAVGGALEGSEEPSVANQLAVAQCVQSRRYARCKRDAAVEKCGAYAQKALIPYSDLLGIAPCLEESTGASCPLRSLRGQASAFSDRLPTAPS